MASRPNRFYSNDVGSQLSRDLKALLYDGSPESSFRAAMKHLEKHVPEFHGAQYSQETLGEAKELMAGRLNGDPLDVEGIATVREWTKERAPGPSACSETTLRNFMRATVSMEPVVPFEKKLMKAMQKLPCASRVSVSRVVNADLSTKYKKNDEFQFWAPTSTTTASDTHIMSMFGGAGPIALFHLQLSQRSAGRDIARYSCFPDEQEVLLLPGAKFKVHSIFKKNGITTITAVEISPEASTSAAPAPAFPAESGIEETSVSSCQNKGTLQIPAADSISKVSTACCGVGCIKPSWDAQSFSFCSAACKEKMVLAPDAAGVIRYVPRRPDIKAEFKYELEPHNFLFVGNPGVGKSTLLNCFIGNCVFKSGFSAGTGMTYEFGMHKDDETGHRFFDTPGLDDQAKRKSAAVSIYHALTQHGKYKIIFVITIEAGRVRPMDATTIKIVLAACPDIGNRYGIVINKVTRNAKTSFADEATFEKLKATLFVDIPVTSCIYLNDKDSELDDENDMIKPLSADIIDFMTNKVPTIEIAPEQVEQLNADTIEEMTEKHESQVSTLLADTEALTTRLENQKKESEAQAEGLKNEFDRKLEGQRAAHTRALEDAKKRSDDLQAGLEVQKAETLRVEQDAAAAQKKARLELARIEGQRQEYQKAAQSKHADLIKKQQEATQKQAASDKEHAAAVSALEQGQSQQLQELQHIKQANQTWETKFQAKDAEVSTLRQRLDDISSRPAVRRPAKQRTPSDSSASSRSPSPIVRRRTTPSDSSASSRSPSPIVQHTPQPQARLPARPQPPSGSSASSQLIPSKYHGKWKHEPTGCTLIITGTSIQRTGYESGQPSLKTASDEYLVMVWPSNKQTARFSDHLGSGGSALDEMNLSTGGRHVWTAA